MNVILICLSSCLFYGICEEGGWRRFLLPELTKIYQARIASVYKTFFWAPWHLPISLSGERFVPFLTLSIKIKKLLKISFFIIS